MIAMLLLATTAFADERLYDLRYKVTPAGNRIAFEITVTELASGRSVLKSSMRTNGGEWGSLHTEHLGRDIRVRMRGETNGYAELTLEVRAKGTLLQRSTFKYTERAAAPPVRYRGEPITLRLRDADLRDVLIALAQLTKTNIAIDPGITGTVTIDLVDVPSDQALDLILRQHGLVRVTEGRVATITRLK
jgi:hypothetical protein